MKPNRSFALLGLLSIVLLATASTSSDDAPPTPTPTAPVHQAARGVTPLTLPIVAQGEHAASTAVSSGLSVIARARESHRPEVLEIPSVDRWDQLIAEVADNDPNDAAILKAFVAMESTGRQFAVSRTGCAGLMQFCAPTAREPMFDHIFRAKRIHTCECTQGRCSPTAGALAAIEAGELRLPSPSFPCNEKDDRFDPRRSLSAGLHYIRFLSGRYDGNLELTYIAYNSGPGVADEIASGLPDHPSAARLARALNSRPEQRARMRTLSTRLLPELREAFIRYRFDQPVVDS